jgi:hypothetical protein
MQTHIQFKQLQYIPFLFPMLLPQLQTSIFGYSIKIMRTSVHMKPQSFNLSKPQTYTGGGLSHPFLISALDGTGWLTSHPGYFTPAKKPWYPLHRRRVDPRQIMTE